MKEPQCKVRVCITDRPFGARPPWLITYLIFQVLTSVVVAAPDSGTAWVQHGLESGAKSIQIPMLGGEAEQEVDTAISDDGRSIAYTTVSADLAGNVNVTRLWVMARGSPRSAKQVGEAVRGSSLWTSFFPRFSPSGDRLAYVRGQTIGIERIDGPEKITIELGGASGRFLGAGLEVTDLRALAWSPNGSKLAAVLGVRSTEEIRTGVELSTTQPYFNDPSAARARLAVYDFKTALWSVESPSSISVDSFDWSPEGDRLAFTGSTGELGGLSYMRSELYIVNLHGGAVSKLAVPLGYSAAPLWSPNGRWIAFETEGPQVRYLAQGRVGLYDLKSGTLSYPAFDDLGSMSGFKAAPVSWAPDSRSLLLRVPYHLSKQLFVLAIPEGRLRRFTPDDDRNFYGGRYDHSGRNINYLSDSFLDPPNIYSSPAAGFQRQKLTNIESDEHLKDVKVSQVAWPSRDGAWTIHGWLLLPASRSDRPIPLLVYAEGGPIMVSPSFRAGWACPLRAFLSNGVAVLIPNSRGRAGYGKEFQMAWETERNPGQGPLEDDLDGVDYLVKLGIVDPERVGLAGLSWGGYLAGYALTHTDRFKAILVNEAVSLNMMEQGLSLAGDPPGYRVRAAVGQGHAV